MIKRIKKKPINSFVLFVCLGACISVLIFSGIIPNSNQWIAFAFVVDGLFVFLVYNFWFAPDVSSDTEHSKPPERYIGKNM